MTDEQINAAIAKACGWKWVRSYQWTDSNGLAAFEWDIPDCCNDLNAMHLAEKTLAPIDLGAMAYWLKEIMPKFAETFHSTARQRAEAFLRALGKWEGTE